MHTAQAKRKPIEPGQVAHKLIKQHVGLAGTKSVAGQPGKLTHPHSKRVSKWRLVKPTATEPAHYKLSEQEEIEQVECKPGKSDANQEVKCKSSKPTVKGANQMQCEYSMHNLIQASEQVNAN